MSRADVDPARPHPVVVSGRVHDLPVAVWPGKLRERLVAAVTEYLTVSGWAPEVAAAAAELTAVDQLDRPRARGGPGPTFLALNREQLLHYAAEAAR